MPKFTCPFCMREYDKKRVQYVCQECNKPSPPGFLEREPIKCKQPGCDGSATVRKCPSCGGKIPKGALETPNLPFSIVGVSNSGKTNYITIMLEELKRTSGLGLALRHQTQETLEHQNTNADLIYNQHQMPEANERLEEGKNLEPQIWLIQNRSRQHGNTVPAYTFTIFDGAGEDHEKALDPSSTVCRYINASKAIILAIDPLVLPAIRQGGVVDREVMRNSLGGDMGTSKNSEDVINSVAEYIKTARGVKTTKKLDIPVAVVLTKFDTILGHRAFGPQAIIRKSSLTIKDGQVDMAEIQQVDGEIRYWLEQIGESPFIDALDANFKEYYFFGVSSYGAPPKDPLTLADEIKPHRVLDPILWLFKREGFID